jgi:hypothetical protein
MCQLRVQNRFQRAATLVNNALHGRRVALPTPAAIWAQGIYHNMVYRSTYIVVMLLLLCLAIWEPSAQMDTSSTAHILVPAFDFVAQALVLWDLFLQFRYHGLGFVRIGWVRIKIVVLLAMFFNLCIHASNPVAYIYLARILRPLLLMERLRNVRRVAVNIGSTLPKILNVVILLIVHVLFFTVLGKLRLW